MRQILHLLHHSRTQLLIQHHRTKLQLPLQQQQVLAMKAGVREATDWMAMAVLQALQQVALWTAALPVLQAIGDHLMLAIPYLLMSFWLRRTQLMQLPVLLMQQLLPANQQLCL
jgi:Zn-dependent alcohol dehydrogenase